LINSDGLSPLKAQKALDKQTIQWKNEYLFNNHGINFDKLPDWQKRGIGIYFMNYEKEGYNPITEQTVMVVRRKLNVNLELPRQNYEYSNLITKLYDNMIVNSKIKERT
jgi:tRNA(His) 5'-end guanylyltransferase